MTSSAQLLRWILVAAAVVACLLTFVWPFTVSADPADPVFRVLAITTLVALLASIAALAFLRLRGQA